MVVTTRSATKHQHEEKEEKSPYVTYEEDSSEEDNEEDDPTYEEDSEENDPYFTYKIKTKYVPKRSEFDRTITKKDKARWQAMLDEGRPLVKPKRDDLNDDFTWESKKHEARWHRQCVKKEREFARQARIAKAIKGGRASYKTEEGKKRYDQRIEDAHRRALKRKLYAADQRLINGIKNRFGQLPIWRQHRRCKNGEYIVMDEFGETRFLFYDDPKSTNRRLLHPSLSYNKTLRKTYVRPRMGWCKSFLRDPSQS